LAVPSRLTSLQRIDRRRPQQANSRAYASFVDNQPIAPLILHEDSQENYGRCKASTCLRDKIKQQPSKNKSHHQQPSWTQPKCKQWSMRPSPQPLLKPLRQPWQLFQLQQQELWWECSQCQFSSQSILLELAILHGTSRLARD
jgi:hypothetical protein